MGQALCAAQGQATAAWPHVPGVAHRPAAGGAAICPCPRSLPAVCPPLPPSLPSAHLPPCLLFDCRCAACRWTPRSLRCACGGTDTSTQVRGWLAGGPGGWEAVAVASVWVVWGLTEVSLQARRGACIAACACSMTASFQPTHPSSPRLACLSGRDAPVCEEGGPRGRRAHLCAVHPGAPLQNLRTGAGWAAAMPPLLLVCQALLAVLGASCTPHTAPSLPQTPNQCNPHQCITPHTILPCPADPGRGRAQCARHDVGVWRRPARLLLRHGC